jgi:hypothetical protein
LLDFWDYSFAFTLICFAGFVDSIAGGGGLITVPTYLFLGLPPQTLLGTNKLVSTVGASFSVLRYLKAGAIDWKRFRTPFIFAICFSALGAWLSRYQSEELMLLILIVVAPAVLVISLRKPKVGPRKVAWLQSFVFLCVLSIILGTYDGFFGPGTGSFFLFSLLYITGLASKEASANARFLNFGSNIGALIFFSSQLQFSVEIAAIGIVAALIGNILGSYFVIHHAQKIVRPLFLIVLSALILKLFYDFF